MVAATKPSKDGNDLANLHHDELLDRLNRQQLAVLREMALAANDAAVAQRLHLSEDSVSKHIGQIVERLSLSDRHAAVRLAREKGLRAA